MSDKPEGYVFGRPTKYRPEMCEQVVELGKAGASKVEIAFELSVSRRVLDDWAAAHPDFLHAITLAKEAEQVWWERTGRTNLATQGFQSSMWSRSMAARFPEDWRETTKQESEVYGKGGGPVNFAVLSGVPRADDKPDGGSD